MTRVYLTGSGWFGQQAAEALTAAGHTITGVSSPLEGRRGGTDLLRGWAERNTTPHTAAAVLGPNDVPDGTDMIIAAHSHAFVGVRTRARARVAIGYHPSLLPLHRGRDAVKWQARDGDRVVGGSIYHLTNRVDGGPIAYQRHIIVRPGITASRLWSEHLAPLGLDLITEAASAMEATGTVPTLPQDDTLATWEPALDAKPLHRPELLELGP